MDPFSVLGVTASIIACIQLTGSLLKVTGRSDYNREDLNRILQVLTGFKGAYEGLKWCLQFNESDHARLSTLQHLEGPLKDSKAVLELLQKRLENLGPVRQFLLGGAWDRRFGKLLKRLEDSKALFELAMHSDHHIILTAVESYIRNAAEDIQDVKEMMNESNNQLTLLGKSMRNNHEKVEELYSQTSDNISRFATQMQQDSAAHEQQEKNESKQKFVTWLSKVDHTVDFNTAYAKHQPGTGLWFIQGEDYLTWRGKSGSFLWLHGSPGCGKTVLCATIINDLKSHCSMNPTCSVAFFYFSFNDTRKQQKRDLLCSIIAQLASQSPCISQDMQQLYQDYQSTEPPLDTLKSTLKLILEQHGDKYIIIDALDECPSTEGNRAEVCALLRDFSNWDLRSLHVLTTSRRQPDIEDEFAKIQDISRVSILNTCVDTDISHYVGAQLVNIPRLAAWPDDLKDEITRTLAEGAQGMFRWAYCQIDALQKCLTRNAVRKALKALPKSLDDTYDRILLSINAEFREYASTALKWLVFAERPLFLVELAEAAIIRPEAALPFDIEDRFQRPAEILHILSGLVVVQEKGTLPFQDDFYAPGFDDETSPIVRLAHFSVKEYLTSDRNPSGPTAVFNFDRLLSSQTMLQSCLSYIDQYTRITSESPEEYYTDDFPLLSYSCEYWPILARTPLQPSTIDLLSECLSTKRWLANWMTEMNTLCEMFEVWCSYDRDEWPESFYVLLEDDQMVLNVALYVLAQFGLKSMLQPLIRLGADPNQSIQVDYEFPIVVAASNKDYHTVQELIQRGADIASITWHRETALHVAVELGDSEIAHLLFNNGFDVNMGVEGLKNSCKTPLITAIYHGGPDMIQLLLDKGAIFNYPMFCELFGSSSKLDRQEEKLLLDKFQPVSKLDREELLEFLIQVNERLTRERESFQKGIYGVRFSKILPDGTLVHDVIDSEP